MSVYSLMKPPKYGNCQLKAKEEHYLTATFLEDKPNQSRLEEFKIKLDGYVEHEIECEAVFENVSMATCSVMDCIVYYVTGLLSRKLLKNTDCLRCRLGLVATQDVTKPEVALVMCKTRGGLRHPHCVLFYLIKQTEEIFQ